MSKSDANKLENITMQESEKEDGLKKQFKANKDKIEKGEFSILDSLPLTSEDTYFHNIIKKICKKD